MRLVHSKFDMLATTGTGILYDDKLCMMIYLSPLISEELIMTHQAGVDKEGRTSQRVTVEIRPFEQLHCQSERSFRSSLPLSSQISILEERYNHRTNRFIIQIFLPMSDIGRKKTPIRPITVFLWGLLIVTGCFTIGFLGGMGLHGSLYADAQICERG